MEFLSFRIVSCVVAVFAVVTNGIVCYVIIRRPQLHNTANWFILSLAVADFGAGLTYIPFNFLCEPGDPICEQYRAVEYAYYVFLSASVTNLCCMVADRYISVVWSLRYSELMTTKRVLLVISSAWICALVWFLILLPIELLHGHETSMKTWKVLFVPLTVIFHLFPSVFLSLATGSMIYIARKLSRDRTVIVAQLNFNQPQEATTVVRVNNSTAKTTSSAVISGAVVGSFVVCSSVGSYLGFCFISGVCKPPRAVWFVSAILYILNSVLNPIAYSVLKSDIKTELKRLFCGSVTAVKD